MVTIKNRFRGVKQNLNRARAYWSVKVWTKFKKRDNASRGSRTSRLKFYNVKNKKKYNASSIEKD